jgi:hypothetical protein
VTGRLWEFVTDERDRLSSKRLAGLVCTAALTAGFLAQVGAAITIAIRHPELPAVPLNESLVWAVAALALGGLGLSSIDKATYEKAEQSKRQSAALSAQPDEGG